MSILTTPHPIADTTQADVDAAVAAAADAADRLRALDLSSRAAYLDAIADALDEDGESLVELANSETHLPPARLRGEVQRTTGQLRMFADAARQASILEATIDTARDDATPRRPDLRRMLVPLGPTLVFAASNFPFAFSVAGGDTASALAAGCPVVVKAHPGHPRLSARVAELVTETLDAQGAPRGTFAVIHGQEAGLQALRHPQIKAAAFTGSLQAGRTLFDVAASRPEPIPFYGELGSVNPVFVSGAAVEERGHTIAEEYVASYTLGVGQFCTKPGLLLLPAGHGLERALGTAVARVVEAPMLNERLHSGYSRGLEGLRAHRSVRVLHSAADPRSPSVGPTLLATTLEAVASSPDILLEECFGPVSLVVEYDDEQELVTFARRLGGQLTATVHAQEHEAERLAPLLQVLTDRAGRVVWNGWPTGVAVSWAMHHGGPYPATTSPLHTAVGVTAVRRFQRPVCYQDLPQALLPQPLRDANDEGLVRRVDGRLTTERVVRT
jgi:NADP-dependent aldehyde dehydrogenase